MGPTYRPPCAEIPDQWKTSQPSPSENPPLGFWWEVFEDETLNCLEQQAIISNPNLYAALDRVAQARAMAGVDRSFLYPQLTLNPSYTNTGTLFQLFLPSGLTSPGTPPPDVFRIHQVQYVLPVNMSFELDLWGKLHRQYESAVFNAQSQEDNFQVALLTLTTDLGFAYFKLRAFDALTDVIAENLQILRENMTLVQSRFSKGLIGEQDVFTAKQQLSDTEAAYYDTVRQRALQENAIAVLIGMPASLFHLDNHPLQLPPPVVQANLPSTVLLQRPDVAAAERTAASEHALIGAAYASFFPSFELTGILGFSSPTFKDFLTWQSRLWSMGFNIAQPLFDGGLNRFNLDLAYASFNEASNIYKQQVLTALQEVEDALVNLEWQFYQYQSYGESTQAAEKRAELARHRYTKGLANYLEVLDSERTKLQAQSNLVDLLGMRYLSTIQLIKALGGSWSSP